MSNATQIRALTDQDLAQALADCREIVAKPLSELTTRGELEYQRVARALLPQLEAEHERRAQARTQSE